MSTRYSYYIHLFLNIGNLLVLKKKIDKWMSLSNACYISWSYVYITLYVNKNDMTYSKTQFTNVINLLNANEPVCTMFVLSVSLSLSIDRWIY